MAEQTLLLKLHSTSSSEHKPNEDGEEEHTFRIIAIIEPSYFYGQEFTFN